MEWWGIDPKAPGKMVPIPYKLGIGGGIPRWDTSQSFIEITQHKNSYSMKVEENLQVDPPSIQQVKFPRNAL